MKYKRLVGILLFIIVCFIMPSRWHVIRELIAGRALEEIPLQRLLLPILLLVVGIYLIISKKKRNEKPQNNS